jgi:probable selenium-dependent hydroxylase accessory protein YqeC
MELYEAYGLQRGDVVAAVGAGGRTRLLQALADATTARGDSVLITATTRSRPRPDSGLPHLRSNEEEVVNRASEALAANRSLVATGPLGENGRLRAFTAETVDALAALGAGLMLIDCDGARERPFKAPGEDEPVVPGSATNVIVCVGLRVLGLPLTAENVHRPEQVAALAPCVPGELVTADLIVEVLTHAEGGRKHVPPGARLSVLLSDPPTGEHERLGQHIAERLVYGGFYRGVVANLDGPESVLAVIR